MRFVAKFSNLKLTDYNLTKYLISSGFFANFIKQNVICRLFCFFCLNKIFDLKQLNNGHNNWSVFQYSVKKQLTIEQFVVFMYLLRVLLFFILHKTNFKREALSAKSINITYLLNNFGLFSVYLRFYTTSRLICFFASFKTGFKKTFFNSIN